MKKLAISAGCLLASLSIFAQGPQTYKGEIIDSQCAALGGHQIMEQKGESAEGLHQSLRKHGRQIHPLRSRNQDRISTRRSEEERRIRRGEGSGDRDAEPGDQDDPRGQHQGRLLGAATSIASLAKRLPGAGASPAPAGNFPAHRPPLPVSFRSKSQDL